MLWFAVWTVLVVGAAVVLGLVARSVFRKGVALVREMGEAAELLGEAAERAERLGSHPDPEPAVFADPHELRRERDRRRRGGRQPARRRSRTGV